MNCDLGPTTVLSASRCTHTWPDPILLSSLSVALSHQRKLLERIPTPNLKMIVDNDKLLEALEARRMPEDQNIDVRIA